jgi:hypothetical protein
MGSLAFISFTLLLLYTSIGEGRLREETSDQALLKEFEQLEPGKGGLSVLPNTNDLNDFAINLGPFLPESGRFGLENETDTIFRADTVEPQAPPTGGGSSDKKSAQ